MTDSVRQNPLLDWSSYPNGAPPLASVKPEDYMPAFIAAIAESRQNIEDIKANRNAPTFDNTIRPLHFSLTGEKKNFGAQYTRVMGVFHNMAVSEAGDDFRAVQTAVESLAAGFVDDVLLDRKLFERIKDVYDNRKTAGLTAEQIATVEETYSNFTRNGALLPDTSPDGGESPAQKLRDVNQRLTTLYSTFGDNLVKATASYKKIITDEKDLDGVPERAKASYAAAAKQAGLPEGQFLIGLQPPPGEIVAYATNRALREEISAAMKNVAFGGAYDNSQVVMDIVAARHEKAQLLGYPTFAAYMLADKMARDEKTVDDFLQKNLDAYKPAAEAYLQKVKDYAVKTDGITDFKSSDFGYYARKLKEDTFKFDMEEVRPYFKLENVFDGVAKHAEKLFGVTLTEVKGKYEVYHPDVKAYEVKNKSGELVGVFYADYFARPGSKKGGAWMEIFRNRGIDDTGENRVPIVINNMNLQKPPEGKPALLSMGEATTLFHEFGHALHGLLSVGENPMVTGYRTKQDAVEMQSQLQENWVWEAEVLKTFAFHNETGEVIPPALVQKVRDYENFDAGFRGLRQTYFGMLDMKWHSTDPAQLKSVAAVEDEISNLASLFPREGAMSTGFHHLFGSDEYAAGYYGYKWAEAMAQDIYTVFQKKGIYDQGTADLVKNTFYAQGGIRHPADMFVEVVGRPLDTAALFRSEGLEPPAANSNNNEKKPPKLKLG